MSKCQSTVSELVSWIKETSGVKVKRIQVYGIRMKVDEGETVEHSNAVVSYFSGKVDLAPSNGLSGDLEQFFSDREKNGQHFDKDTLNLHIQSNGRVQFTLKSWNNHIGEFAGACEDGLIYGFDGDRLFWVINLTKVIYEG